MVMFSAFATRVTQELPGDKMPRTVSASEAKNRLGSLIEWALTNQDEVIVESYGKPKAVIMRYTEYETITELRAQSHRQAILARLHQLRQQVQSRNRDLTEEQAIALADRFSREVVKDLIEADKIRHQGS
jgi:prevent-host-death family protein